MDLNNADIGDIHYLETIVITVRLYGDIAVTGIVWTS